MSVTFAMKYWSIRMDGADAFVQFVVVTAAPDTPLTYVGAAIPFPVEKTPDPTDNARLLSNCHNASCVEHEGRNVVDIDEPVVCAKLASKARMHAIVQTMITLILEPNVMNYDGLLLCH